MAASWAARGEGGRSWESSWSRYAPYFLLCLLVFALGLAFGGLATGVLDRGERLQLLTSMERLVHWETGPMALVPLYRRALIENLKVLGLLYILGISVAGIPLVLAVLFFRGFVIGFAVAYVSQNVHWLGIATLLATVVVQNLFMVPVYLVAGTLALWFSVGLLSSRRGIARGSLWPAFGGYTGMGVVLAVALAWATVVEVAGSPLLLHVSHLIR